MPQAIDSPETIESRLRKVRSRIAAVAKRAGRDPDEITLVAVSKTKPFSAIRAALEAGQRDFGENRIEELWDKTRTAQDVGLDQIRWHIIGTIQSRKTPDCIGPFVLNHAVDRVKIARRLNRDAGRAGIGELPVLLEINVSGEESKHGFAPEALKNSMPKLLEYPLLRYQGLMTMAPLVDDAERTRPFFRRLRELLDWLKVEYPADQHQNVDWRHLSMGMTQDYEVAIEEGATIVRIGTAIFGHRD